MSRKAGVIGAAALSIATLTGGGMALAHHSKSAQASAPGPAGPKPPTGACADLSATFTTRELGAGMGKATKDIVLTNRGTSTCTLKGVPGLAMLDGAGRQVGADSTTWEGSRPAKTVAIPGHGAGHITYIEVIPNFDSGDCQRVKSASLRVDLPHQGSLTLPYVTELCSNQTDGLLMAQPVTKDVNVPGT